MSGTKPLINCWLIFLFIVRLKQHVKMLRTMDGVDMSFKSAFRKTPNMRKHTWLLFTLFALSMVVPFAWRFYEVYTDGLLSSSWRDPSFILVPLLTAWNILPLLYYHLCNSVARFWCTTLKKTLRREHFKRHYALKFYYEQFLKITAMQETIGDLFNPFVLFSLAWSFMLLSLTIYFVTQPTSSLVEPITAEQVTNESMRNKLNEKILINVGWSVIQIIVAILHICVICANGMKTNEETRNILTAVLAIVPDANADLDRFQVE
uniref:Uncharacterized protein n=2 Tax=Acrobeloides nanus TaxID=290746 RepID=A0A914EN01_9BILA